MRKLQILSVLFDWVASNYEFPQLYSITLSQTINSFSLIRLRCDKLSFVSVHRAISLNFELFNFIKLHIQLQNLHHTHYRQNQWFNQVSNFTQICSKQKLKIKIVYILVNVIISAIVWYKKIRFWEKKTQQFSNIFSCTFASVYHDGFVRLNCHKL